MITATLAISFALGFLAGVGVWARRRETRVYTTSRANCTNTWRTHGSVPDSPYRVRL